MRAVVALLLIGTVAMILTLLSYALLGTPKSKPRPPRRKHHWRWP